MKRTFSIVSCLGLLCCVAAAQAQSTATFNYVTSANKNTDPGTFAVYLNNGSTDVNKGSYSITAYGFYTASASVVGTAVDLYNANLNTEDTGIGVYDKNRARSDKEIDVNHFVQFDVKALKDKGFQTLTWGINSGEVNEGYRLYGSNTLGLEGDLLAQDYNSKGAGATKGLNVTAFLTADYRYYSITAYGDPKVASILIANGTAVNNTQAYGGGAFASVAPDGSSGVMLICGLAPVLWLGCRRIRRTRR